MPVPKPRVPHQLRLVLRHGPLRPRRHLVAGRGAVQVQQRGRDRLGDRGGQPRVPVQDHVAVEPADPPQQDGREGAVAGLLAVRLDPRVAAVRHRPQRQDPPRPVVDEPVDVPVGMPLDDRPAPVCGERQALVVPAQQRTLAREQPPPAVQRPVRRLRQVLREAVRPPVRPPGRLPRGHGPHRRDDGAVGAGTPELDPAVIVVHSGEEHRPLPLDEQQPPLGGEQAQSGPVAGLHLQGQALPAPVAPEDVPAPHAGHRPVRVTGPDAGTARSGRAGPAGPRRGRPRTCWTASGARPRRSVR